MLQVQEDNTIPNLILLLLLILLYGTCSLVSISESDPLQTLCLETRSSGSLAAPLWREIQDEDQAHPRISEEEKLFFFLART
jgi:hypothetical protein